MTPPPPSSWRTRLRALGPWLVALLVLAWLFHMVPIDDLGHTLRRAPLVPFLLFNVLYVVGTLTTDSFATWATFRAALPDVRLRFVETFELRAASYLLAIVHYGAGQGGLGWFLHRKYKVELARVAGAVMLVMGVNVIVVALCALVGVFAGGIPGTDLPALRWLVLGLACGFPAYLAVILAHPQFLARQRLLRPLFTAGVIGHLRAALARIPHIGWLIACNIVGMHMFGIRPSLGEAITLLPIVFVVAVLPISPSGLGTAQAVSVALLARFAEGDSVVEQRAAVLAYSLSMQFLALILQAGIGLAFLRRATRADTVDSSVSAQ